MNVMSVKITLKGTVITQEKSDTTKCRGSQGSWRDIATNAEGSFNRDQLIGIYAGCSFTRSIQARIFGKSSSGKPPSWDTWV
jgi:hypothetical protein